MAKSDLTRAIDAIDRRGVLLVYPLANRTDPESLWSVLYPKVPMRWSWTQDADARVAAIWELRGRLAESRRVVYAKWLGGRATFFSRDLFRTMLATLRDAGDLRRGLSRDASQILDVLLEDSPLATKALRALTELEGRKREPEYTRATRALWTRLLVVGAGEVAEGGFPSLAMGATELLFEDLWSASRSLDTRDSARLAEVRARSRAFDRAFGRALREIAA